MTVFKTAGRHGYSVKWSPFEGNRLLYVACENYGISGRGYVHHVELLPNASIVCRCDRAYSDVIFDVTWSETNPNICIGAGGDGTIQVWNVANANESPSTEPLQVMKEHTKEVYSIESCPIRGDDRYASGSWDKTVKVWSPNRLESIATLTGHSSVVYCASWSPHIPDCIASTSGDSTLRIWSMKCPGSERLVIPAHETEILSCDWNKYDENVLATASTDGLVRGWDLRNTRRFCFELQGHEYAVRRVKFSPHGESILATVSYDFTTRIWNYRESSNAIEILKNHTEFVYGLDFNLHVIGQVADCSFDQTLRVYDLAKMLTALTKKS